MPTYQERLMTGNTTRRPRPELDLLPSGPGRQSTGELTELALETDLIDDRFAVWARAPRRTALSLAS